jgi:hypothetical protein
VRLPAPASVVEGERPASGRDALGSANDGMDEADATADHVSISGAYCSAGILNVQAMAAQASMPIRLGGRATRGACRARGMPTGLECAPATAPLVPRGCTSTGRAQRQLFSRNLRTERCPHGVKDGPDGDETRLPVNLEQRTLSREPSWSVSCLSDGHSMTLSARAKESWK